MITTTVFCLALMLNFVNPQHELHIQKESISMADSFGGLALYSVRNEMQIEPGQTLEKVAEIGYKYIEAAGYGGGRFYGMEPAEFNTYLQSLGLEPLSTHNSAVTLDNADEMIADAKAAGMKYFVVPIPPMGHFRMNQSTKTIGMSNDLEEIVSILNTLGEKCTSAGIELLYHNHNFEFEENADGIVPMDYFIEHTDPQYVNFQMDIYWVVKAGADPVEYFKKAPGRFKTWHVKDMDSEGNFTPVGTGTIDFAKILANKDLSGMEYYFVEQDMAFGQTPLEAIEVSHEGLKEIGFK